MNWHTLFMYDEESPSGLRWAVDVYSGWHKKKLEKAIGDVAGRKSGDGYFVISINNKSFMAHRVIWEMFNGPIPVGMEIDHEDGQVSRNVLENFRLVTSAINSRNKKLGAANTSGIVGVRLYEPLRKGKVYRYWRAFWSEAETGRYVCADFSIEKLGFETARELAIEKRRYEIERMNAEGAGYSLRHGTTKLGVDYQ